MNPESTEDDRLREAFAAGPAKGAPGAPCAQPARIWAAARGVLPPDETRSLLAHSIECADCAAAWRLAAELGVEGEPAGAWAVRWRWVAAAAALLVVAVAPIWLTVQRQEVPTYREEGRAEIRSLVPEDQPQPRSRCLLRWSPGPEGARYSVRVSTGDLRVLATARGLESPEYLVPAPALRDLPPGARIFWRVESLTDDGGRDLSMTFAVRIE